MIPISPDPARLRPHTSRAVAATLAALALAYAGASHEAVATVPDAPPPIVLAAVIPMQPAEPRAGTYSPVEVNRIMAHIRQQEYDQALELATAMTRTSPSEAIGFKLQGAAYFGKGNLAEARKSFEKALSLQADDDQALVYLAQLDVAEKSPANARKRYEQILARDSKYVPAVIGVAQLDAAAGNERAARDGFQKARDIVPDALLPRIYLGNYYLKHNDLSAALAEATEAHRAHPDSPEAVGLLGQVQTASGMDSQAVRTFRQLVALAPASVLAQYQLASLQLKVGDDAGAAATLRRIVALEPDNVDAAYGLATLEIKAGHIPEALKIARRLQAAKATAAVGATLEGDVHLAERKFAEALSSYETALAAAKTTLMAMKVHQAQEALGRRADANARLLRWMTDHPEDAGGWQYLAGAYVRNGNRKGAIAQYERLLKDNPRNVVAMNNLAALYLDENDPRALPTAEKAHALTPESPMTADTLGWINLEKGNVARGLELVRSAADKEPNNAEVRYHLAVALAKSGNKPEARRELERLIGGGQAFAQRQAAQDLLKQL